MDTIIASLSESTLDEDTLAYATTTTTTNNKTKEKKNTLITNSPNDSRKHPKAREMCADLSEELRAQGFNPSTFQQAVDIGHGGLYALFFGGLHLVSIAEPSGRVERHYHLYSSCTL